MVGWNICYAFPGFVPLRDSSPQLILAANGWFKAKRSVLADAVVLQAPLGPRSEGLEPLEARLTLRTRIREIDFARMLAAFRRTAAERGTEMFFYLTYDRSTGTTGVLCPPQRNGRASVEVDRSFVPPDGLLLIGSNHSHPCSAFHSSGDREDEEFSDGLHIVCGDLDRVQPTVAASLVVWGHRQELSLQEVIEPDSEMQAWMSQLHVEGFGGVRNRVASTIKALTRRG